MIALSLSCPHIAAALRVLLPLLSLYPNLLFRMETPK